MKRSHRQRREIIAQSIKPNFMDRVVSYISPMAGARRMRGRAFMALAGGYLGDAKSKRVLSQWNPHGNDADTDILPDLSDLREYSRDLIRKNPLAAGAIKTKVTNVVGGGFKMKAQLDRDFLSVSEDVANIWEQNVEREWALFWGKKTCDVERILTGNAIARLVYRQAKENGDVLVILPHAAIPGAPYSLKLQVIEADRLCNTDNKADTETLAGGIQRDKNGAPSEYHILEQHPGRSLSAKANTWKTIKAYGSKTGLPNIIHLYQEDRPGQSRGVPDLAPVIESLKQLSRLTDAELMATVLSSYFTVFVETESGETSLVLNDFSDETGAGGVDSDEEYKLGQGAIIGLANGEKISTATPGRPNDSFDPFVKAILRQVGVALELPFEILIKHFTASYSAARAALLEGWKYFVSERSWLVENFLSIVYEVWMHEAVAIGRVAAPGFFSDPAIRQAYLGAQWIGPARGMINEKDEIKAAKDRVEMGVSTLAEETAQITGGDWERKHPQRVREHTLRKEAGLIEKEEAPEPASAVAQGDN